MMNMINKWREKKGQIFRHDEIENSFIINRLSHMNMYMRLF